MTTDTSVLIFLVLLVLFYWPVWWMCWDLFTSGIKALLGIKEDHTS